MLRGLYKRISCFELLNSDFRNFSYLDSIFTRWFKPHISIHWPSLTRQIKYVILTQYGRLFLSAVILHRNDKIRNMVSVNVYMRFKNKKKIYVTLYLNQCLNFELCDLYFKWYIWNISANSSVIESVFNSTSKVFVYYIFTTIERVIQIWLTIHSLLSTNIIYLLLILHAMY